MAAGQRLGDGHVGVEAAPETAQTLPNFLLIGSMKAGTTSMYEYLKAHEQIFMPDFKELDFFVAEANWSRGVDWYRRQFSTAGDAPARGEASTAYTQYPLHDGVPERIARVLPDARLVYVVRDPVERIRSHYQHLVMTGVEKRAPRAAVLEDPVYLACSRYAMQLERYLDHFPPEQILVVTSEGLKADRKATVQRVYDFLGVDSADVPDVLGTEFYRTAQRPTYPAPVLWARRFATRHMVRARCARGFAEKVLARRPGAPAREAGAGADAADQVLDGHLRAQVVDLLHDDIARLRRHLPAGFDGWGYL